MQPYATQAAFLERLLLDFQHARGRRNMTLKEIAAVFGVRSGSTVKAWLDGVKHPQRAQAISIAEGLGLADPFQIARLYGHEELEDNTPATVQELIHYAESYDGWDDTYRAAIVSRLHMAADPPNRYDREVIGDMLRKPYSLALRAERVAQFADMAASHPLLAVA